jgi:hypothetical protein
MPATPLLTASDAEPPPAFAFGMTYAAQVVLVAQQDVFVLPVVAHLLVGVS